jgi:hypothetical protein
MVSSKVRSVRSRAASACSMGALWMQLVEVAIQCFVTEGGEVRAEDVGQRRAPDPVAHSVFCGRPHQRVQRHHFGHELRASTQGLAPSGPEHVRSTCGRDAAASGRRYRRTVWLALATLGSAVATLVNPCHVYLYGSVIDPVRLTDPFIYITELQAFPVRAVRDWLVLMLALS